MLRIRFSGFLRQVTGCAETEIELPPSRRLSAVLEILDRTYPGVLGASAEYQWRHGSSDVVIAVNDTIVLDGNTIVLDGNTIVLDGTVQDANPDPVLADGDHITLLPPLGGGGSAFPS